VLFCLTAADAIPDGRLVQYALSIAVAGGSGNTTVTFANITALLISG